ncbi:MAG: AmmeMemoRadiSam system radical SAM enzyme [Verrucomicrobia bacterium]|nr:AmmeMemoRadiSam system radical SAM enzyme [Verrucomicrobiota bacterium]
MLAANKSTAVPGKRPLKSRVASEALSEVLDRRTVVGTLWQREGDRVRCFACGHRCLIGEGRRGICKVRFNQDGQLRVPFGYVAGVQCDPVEKKPFFHVYPGSDALTFGMMGCDFHCGYCQNWVTSQALRDEASVAAVRPVTADQLLAAAHDQGARLVVSSYNEPLITAEWSVSIFQKATAEGFLCAFVSNGNATPQALDFVRPWLAAYKIDLKSFKDQRYRALGGTLEHVTEAIRLVHQRKLWLEVLTLIVPGFNDDEQELRALTRFLAGIDRNIPWHVTAFHKDYKMTEPNNTTARDLMRAAEIGAGEGLNFVYAGNLPGRVGEWENTRCPSCHQTLIERYGFLVHHYRITPKGHCPFCRATVPGLWPKAGPADVRTGEGMGAYYQRLPKPVPLPWP